MNSIDFEVSHMPFDLKLIISSLTSEYSVVIVFSTILNYLFFKKINFLGSIS